MPGQTLRFLQKIRSRFIVSFVAVVAVLTVTVVSLINSDYRHLIDRSAYTSLDALSESIFQALWVSMNYGDSAVVLDVLRDAQEKQIVDGLDLYVSQEVIEIFRPDLSYRPPGLIEGVFQEGEERFLELIDDRGERLARFIKPLRADQGCLQCHVNAEIGTVLGVMDLTLSLSQYDAQAAQSIQRIVLTILVLVGISALLLHLISQRLIFTPLDELGKATRKLSQEAADFDVRLKTGGRNEFGVVAHQFNRFIMRVQKINQELAKEQARTRELLETREEEIERRTAEVRELHRKLQSYVRIVDQNVITSRTDENGIITYASEAFCRVSGFSKEDLIGKPHSIVRHPDTPASLFERLWRTLKAGKSWEGELKNRTKSGHFYWVKAVISPEFDEAGKITGFVAVRQDVTLQKRLEATLEELTEMTRRSHTDALTGLFNRSRMSELLEMEIVRAERYKTPFSVALMDVDHFKSINDTYGHLEGDEVLKALAEILRDNTRKSDIIARWGGEEFIILLPNTAVGSATRKVEQLRKAVADHPFAAIGQVTASFGVAQWQAGDDEESLVGRADVALYLAKESGRNRVEVAPEAKESHE